MKRSKLYEPDPRCSPAPQGANVAPVSDTFSFYVLARATGRLEPFSIAGIRGARLPSIIVVHPRRTEVRLVPRDLPALRVDGGKRMSE